MITKFNEYLVPDDNDGLGLDSYTPNELGALLSIACTLGNIPISRIKSLIEHGADIGFMDLNGDTPLHIAVNNSRLSIVRAWVETGADVNIKDNSGWAPIHKAASQGKLEILKLLISGGADLDIKTKFYGWTPLHYAATRGYIEETKVLLAAGASKDVRDANGKTPWDVAKPGIQKSIPELKP